MKTLWMATACAVLAVACSEDDGTGGAGDSEASGGAPGAGGGPGSGGSPTRAEDPFSCPSPGYGVDPVPQAFRSLNGTVVDLDGQPVEGINVQACGLDLCVDITDTDATGTVNLAGVADVAAPAFKYGIGRRYAKLALPLGTETEHDVGEQRAIPLPASGGVLEPGGSPSSAGVTLELPVEMNPIEPDPFDFETDEQRQLRGAEVPMDLVPDAVDAALGLERVIALTPVGTKLCPAPTMVIDNTLAWEAGAAVEVYLHGVEIAEEWAPYGGWAKVADATVSEDGSAIVTVQGEGLPIISVIGLRRAP